MVKNPISILKSSDKDSIMYVIENALKKTWDVERTECFLATSIDEQ